MNMLSIPGAPGWFETLLNMSLQATLLTGVVWIVLKIFGRWVPPNWRALMWFLVIARVVIPFTSPSELSLLNFFTMPPSEVTPIVQFQQAPEAEFSVPPAVASHFARETPTVTVVANAGPSAPRRAVSVGEMVMNIWRIGALFLLALLGLRAILIRFRLVRHGAAPAPFILELLEECRAELGLRYSIRVTVSDQIAAPALTGILPARLIIPTTFGTPRFTPAQMRRILLHELAHVRQGHLFLHWLTLIARAIHWFNPAIHFAANRLRQECEIAADRAALKNSTSEERATYGETILQVLVNSKAAPTLLALGMAEQARHLQQRLRALTTSQRFFTPLGVACVLFVGLAGVVGGAAPADQKDSAPGTNSESELRAAAAAAEKIEKANSSTKTPALNTNSPAISAARKRLLEKLETIRIDDLPVTANTPLIEILKELGSEVRKRDPSGRGVNFIISQGADGSGATVDVEQFQIRFDPPIRDVSLGQFFEALVHVAKPPPDGPQTARLKYTVEDYAVIFSEDVKDSATVPPRKSVASADTSGASEAASSAARQKILQKLDSIGNDDFPLSSPVDLIEVLKELGMESRKFDPEHRGINFVVDKAKSRAANATIDLEKFQIQIDPPVRNVTLHQLCDVMVRVGTPPANAPKDAALEYTITDYGVVFSLRARTNEAYASRTFQINPNTFMKALNAVLPRGSGATQADVQQQVRAFAERAGLAFPTNVTANASGESPHKAIFYNDRNGVLYVRAPVEELDLIENAIHALNFVPPLVSIRVEAAEIPQELKLRIEKEIAMADKTPVLATNEFLFVTPKEASGEPVLLCTKNLRDVIKDPVAVANVTFPATQAVVTAEDKKKVTERLEKTGNVDLLAAPNITTLLGREARVSVEETRNILTPKTVKTGGVPATLGLAVDCLAEDFDGTNMRLNCTVNMTEFLEYDKAGGASLPKFRVRSIGSRTKLAPGTTQIFLMPSTAPKRVPALADIPNLGRLFENAKAARYLLIFVTPVIVDPAGNIVLPKTI